MDGITLGAFTRLLLELKQKRAAKCLNIDCVVNHRIGGNDMDIALKHLQNQLKTDTLNV